MLVRESLPPSFWIRKLYHLWPSIVLPYIGFEGLVNPGRTNWICAAWSHRQDVVSMVEDIWFSTTSTDGSEMVTMSWRVTHIFSFLSTTLTFSRHLSLSEFSPILYFFLSISQPLLSVKRAVVVSPRFSSRTAAPPGTLLKPWIHRHCSVPGNCYRTISYTHCSLALRAVRERYIFFQFLVGNTSEFSTYYSLEFSSRNILADFLRLTYNPTTHPET